MNAIQEEFNSIEKLYHYTRFESCMKIIRSNTLLFGRLKDMNDINELYRPLYSTNLSCENAEKAQNLINKLQQISLTRDKKKMMGFDIPSMWGHYGDKGNGVCLVFDKQKLLNILSNNELILFKGEIKYRSSFHSSISVKYDKYGNIKPFSKNELKQFFFSKTKDWINEQEYRILAINNINQERLSLSLQDSLMAIIMHNASDVENHESVFSSKQYDELSKIFNPDKIWEYGTFVEERNIRNNNGDTIWSTVNLNNLKINI